MNIQVSALIFGPTRLAVGTLTSVPWETWETFMKKIKAATPALLELFPDGLVRVIDFNKAGRLHVHFVGIAKTDIATGFDWAAYHELRRLGKARTGGRLTPEELQHRCRLGRSLTTNKDLLALRNGLRKIQRKYKFARRLELIPVRVNPRAVGRYFTTNYFRCVRNPLRPRGGRSLGYLGPFPVLKPTGLTRGQILFRRKVEAFLKAIAWDEDSMCCQYGARWRFKLMRALGVFDHMLVHCGPDPDKWSPQLVRHYAAKEYGDEILDGYQPPTPIIVLSPRDELIEQQRRLRAAGGNVPEVKLPRPSSAQSHHIADGTAATTTVDAGLNLVVCR